MKRCAWLVLLLVLFSWISGCGKGKETPKGEMRHEAKAATTEATKKPGGTEMEEMKGMTMESIQKEGRMQEMAPATARTRVRMLPPFLKSKTWPASGQARREHRHVVNDLRAA